MKRIIAASLLGISATVNTVHGQGALLFSNYNYQDAFGNYDPIAYDASLGFIRSDQYGTNSVSSSDGVQISVWAAEGTGLSDGDLFFIGNANLSVEFDGFTVQGQVFTIPGGSGNNLYEAGETWTFQFRASGTIGPVANDPVDELLSRGPLIELSNIGDQSADPPSPALQNDVPGFTVYRDCYYDGPPFFTGHPTDHVAGVGTNVQFSVSVGTDTCSSIAYQWQVDQVSIPGATNSTLILTNVQVADSGLYRAEVTRTVTNAVSDFSSEAVLQVLPPGAPSTEVDGQIAVGSVSAIGSAQIEFIGGFPGGFIFYTLDGSTPTLTNSPLYSGPFTITNSATIQAMSLSADFAQTAYTQPVVVDVVPVYLLQTSVVGSGTVTNNPTGGSYPSNTVVTLTANAAQYWAFDQWTGDASGSANPTAVTMDGPKSVEAVFSQTDFPVTVSTPGGGVVTVNGQTNPPTTYYPLSSVLSLEAVTNSGWSFIEWQGAVQSTNATESLTVNGTNVVQAIFGTDVATNASGSGSIALSESNPVPYGTLLEAYAVHEPGSYLLAWGGALSGTNDPATLHVTNPAPLVSALFVSVPPGTYTINARVNGDGQVAVDPIQPYYTAGSTVTLTASETNHAFYADAEGDVFTSSTFDISSVEITNNATDLIFTINLVGDPAADQTVHPVLGIDTPPLNSGGDTAGNGWTRQITMATGMDYWVGSWVNAGGGGQLWQYSGTWANISGVGNAITTSNVTLTVSYLAMGLSAGDTIQFDAFTTSTVGGGDTNGPADSLAAGATQTITAWTQGYNSPGNLSYTITGTTEPSNSSTPFVGWSGDASGTDNPLAVTLDTNKVVYANFAETPIVSLDPTNLIVIEGSNGVLTANAVGLPPLYYQWQNDSGLIPGETNTIYAISNAVAADTGDYSVIVSNVAGVVTSEVATVTVVFPPEITLNPFSQNLPAGDSMTLAVLADGTQPLSYKWYKNSVEIPPLYGTNSTLVVDPLTTNSTGSYWVVVSNPYGAATSSVANVFIYIPVNIVLPPVSKVAPAFTTVQFSVAADGYPDPGYQWFFDGGAISGGTLPMLTVSNLDLPDLGQYSVLVSNAYSSELSPPAMLSMSPSLVSPFVGATAIWGLDALLSVGAIGSDTLGYQWYKDGVAIGGATSDTLLIPSVQFTNAGLYSVVVSSVYGDITNTPAQLVVNPAGVSLGLYAGITINGAIGNTLTIEYTTDLTDTNSWLVATNLTLQQEVELWVDESVEARSLPKRFYRVLPGP